MDGNGTQNPTGGNPPPKPWERSGSSSGTAPFKPPSAGNTSDVVEASGTANPGEIVSTSDRNVGVNTNALGRPLPSRPWENNNGTSSYGGYGSGMNYNSSYGAGTLGGGGMYGSSYGGGMYGSSGGMYGGSSMYRGGYGGGGLYGSGTLGGGMYGGGYGGGMGGGYGMGGMGMGGMGMGGMGMGGPYGPQDPNNPYGEPSAPPGFWISFLRVMQGVVSFFGRISILVDQNTQAVHFFMSALLQLFDRGGMLYGELARFAMRLLGVRTRPPKLQGPQGPNQLPGPQMQALEGPKPAPSGGAWDNVWGNDVSK